MAAWMLVLQKLHDAAWLEDYVTHVPTIMRTFGGEYAAIGPSVERIESQLFGADAPAFDQVAIFSFPSADAIRAFLASADYARFAEVRKAGSASDIFILDCIVTEFGA